MKKLFYLSFAAIAALFTSCNKDVTVPTAELPGIQREVAVRPVGATKSAVHGTAFPQAYDMLVSAYRNLGSNPGEDVAANYFEGIHFAYDGVSGSWKSTNGAKYYPLDGTLDFLAVASAGFNTAANGVVPTAAWGDAGNVAKKVVLTVPDNSAKFDDLMYGASNAQGLSASGTAMAFNHAMTSVVFVARCNVGYNAVSNVGITVDGITIDGAKYSGTLTVLNPSAAGGSGDLSAEWSALGDAKTHIAARVWNAANLGNNPSETELTGLNLTTAYKDMATYKFGEAYVILPPQDAVPFTITYTVHNGFAADGSTKLDNQVQYQVVPTGTWGMAKKNIYAIDFTLTEIRINPTVVDWDEVPGVDTPVPQPVAGKFADLEIAAGPLCYNGTSYEIKDSWNNDSFNSIYGVADGSYYFSFVELGQLFEKAGFATSDGDIDNLLNPLDGWRLPTKTDWERILTTDGATRPGSTVNGSAKKHFALVKVTATHAGEATPNGLLIFPDGGTIAGKALSGMDNYTQTTGVTLDELNAYLGQGCAFLPASGSYIASWANAGANGSYWSSSEVDASNAFFAGFSGSSLNAGDSAAKSAHLSVRLVK